MSSPPADLDLLESIAALLRDQEQSGPSNRRQQERHSYGCVQLVAPFDGSRVPGARELRHVQCRDLSSGGFSYFGDERPRTQQVLVALGQIPFRFYVADIVRVRGESLDGREVFHIGCRFVRRFVPQ